MLTARREGISVALCIQPPGVPELIQTWAVISEDSQPGSLEAGRMHRPLIITSRFFFWLLFLSESQIAPVQETVLSSLAALLSREFKMSVGRKDPGALTSCECS